MTQPAAVSVPSVCGYRFVEGPTIESAEPIDYTLPYSKFWERVAAWSERIDEAVRWHDAWGLLVHRGDGDIVLYDVMVDTALPPSRRYTRAARDGGRITLLLGQEARPR